MQNGEIGNGRFGEGSATLRIPIPDIEPRTRGRKAKVACTPNQWPRVYTYATNAGGMRPNRPTP